MKRLVSTAALAASLGAILAVNACGGQQVVRPDTGTPDGDAGTAGKTVKVTYDGRSTLVALGQIAPVTVGGVSLVKLGDVVAAALPAKALDQLAATDLISSDGFTPRSKSNCDGLLPLAGATLERGYIDPATRTLKWDDALTYPGCMTVTDTAEIVVAEAGAPQPDASVAGPDAGAPVPDAGAQGRTVKVTYNGSSTEVSLDAPVAVPVGGASVDTLSDVIAIAVPGKANDLLALTGIVGSDGFNPATKPFCSANFPVDGAKLPQGYIDRSSREVTWDPALGLPGCVGVGDTAALVVADK